MHPQSKLVDTMTATPSRCPAPATVTATPLRISATPVRAPLTAILLLTSNAANKSDQSIQSIISAEIRHKTRMVKALTKAMVIIFSTDQLATCSMKGAATVAGEPKQALPVAE